MDEAHQWHWLMSLLKLTPLPESPFEHLAQQGQGAVELGSSCGRQHASGRGGVPSRNGLGESFIPPASIGTCA
jgi:hypothetical protein